MPIAENERLIGISAPGKLLESLQAAGFLPAKGKCYEGLPFRKPIDKLGNVKDLTLNAQNWRAADDLYASFFESSGSAGMARQELRRIKGQHCDWPDQSDRGAYRIRIQNYARMSRAARHLADPLIDLIQRFEGEGGPVSVLVDE